MSRNNPRTYILEMKMEAMVRLLRTNDRLDLLAMRIFFLTSGAMDPLSQDQRPAPGMSFLAFRYLGYK